MLVQWPSLSASVAAALPLAPLQGAAAGAAGQSAVPHLPVWPPLPGSVLPTREDKLFPSQNGWALCWPEDWGKERKGGQILDLQH